MLSSLSHFHKQHTVLALEIWLVTGDIIVTKMSYRSPPWSPWSAPTSDLTPCIKPPHFEEWVTMFLWCTRMPLLPFFSFRHPFSPKGNYPSLNKLATRSVAKLIFDVPLLFLSILFFFCDEKQIKCASSCEFLNRE